MRVFIRTFNNKINSKIGTPLPEGQYRGTPEWLIFQRALMETLEDMGHEIITQPEHPIIPDGIDSQMSPDRRIYVHLTKREKPHGDLFWMQMHLRNLFTIDTNGWGIDHSGVQSISPMASDPLASKEFCQTLSEKFLLTGQSKCAQPDYTEMTPGRFILVPVQIPRDYTIRHHSPITVKYFLESLQAWAIETENHLVFKFHPFNANDFDLHAIIREAQESSKYIHKVEGNIHELIKRSSGVFVINSGTGFEALIHGKPVCTFGDCDYRSATFNADIRRLEEARNFVYSYKPEWKQMAYQFVYTYYHNHAYDINDSNLKVRLWDYLKGAL